MGRPVRAALLGAVGAVGYPRAGGSVLSLLSAFAWAAAPAPEVRIPLTLFDAPENLRGVLPAPRQSLDLAYGLDRLTLLGVKSAATAMFPRDEQAALRQGIGLAMAYSSSALLLFVNSYAHEEWHRAVLSRRGVSSRNGLFFPEAWGEGKIAVDQVADDDLATLKANHPAEYVRLHQAGLEATRIWTFRLHDERFSRGHEGSWWGPLYLGDSWTAPLAQVQWVSDFVYYQLCTSPNGESLTETATRQDRVPQDRDFTGLDCVAWAYDLSRPDEPYADRGPHPFGPGVDRYRAPSDLTPQETRWLRLARDLHTVNLLDPQLLGVDGFRAGEKRWIAAAEAGTTPYGLAVGLRGGLTEGPTATVGRTWRAAVRVHFTEALVLPELQAGLTQPLGEAWVFEGRLSSWLFPQELRWDAQRAAPGGLIGLGGRYVASRRWDLWASVDAKSRGFQAGVLDLEPALTLQAGLATSLGR